MKDDIDEEDTSILKEVNITKEYMNFKQNKDIKDFVVNLFPE